MIQRELVTSVSEMLDKYPIISLTGPRQSGKTTLAKMVRPNCQYVNLENLSSRAFAKDDPVGFLETYQHGVIIDEAQYVPELFSYLQVFTDERKRKGEYILTCSQNFLMMEKITQSLAGRVAIFYLLPFSLKELKGTAYQPESWEEYMLTGSYPSKLVDDIDASTFYDNYLRTYIERDVRPYHPNFSKRVVSTPKVYFYDIGLAAHLLGISTLE